MSIDDCCLPLLDDTSLQRSCMLPAQTIIEIERCICLSEYLKIGKIQTQYHKMSNSRSVLVINPSTSSTSRLYRLLIERTRVYSRSMSLYRLRIPRKRIAIQYLKMSNPRSVLVINPSTSSTSRTRVYSRSMSLYRLRILEKEDSNTISQDVKF